VLRLVRLDHIAVDNGICRIGGDKSKHCHNINKRQNERNGNADRKQQNNQENMKRKEQNITKKRHNISLDSKNREDQCILQDLKIREFKGDEKMVDIKSHHNINDSHQENHKIHHIDSERCSRSIIEEDEINDENGADNKIKKSHKEALLEILFDAMEKVRKNEHGISSEKSAEYVGRSHRGPAPSQRKEEYHNDSQNVHPRAQDGKLHLNRREI